MQQEIIDQIEQARGFALATDGPHGLNVVPVSVVRIVGDTIQLFNFFMRKTAENITTSPYVALACWNGFSGIQIKADTAYHEAGAVFEEASIWAKGQHPDRTLKGVIVLTPTEVFDASVSTEAPGAALNI